MGTGNPAPFLPLLMEMFKELTEKEKQDPSLMTAPSEDPMSPPDVCAPQRKSLCLALQSCGLEGETFIQINSSQELCWSVPVLPTSGGQKLLLGSISTRGPQESYLAIVCFRSHLTLCVRKNWIHYFNIIVYIIYIIYLILYIHYFNIIIMRIGSIG